VFKNKLDEDGLIIINKARLATKVNSQEEGINCDESMQQWPELKL